MNILVENVLNQVTVVTKTPLNKNSARTRRELDKRATYQTWDEVDLSGMQLIIIAVNSKDVLTTKSSLETNLKSKPRTDERQPPYILVATKGMPESGDQFSYEYFKDLGSKVGVLSGPNLATEFARNRSTAVIAFEESKVAQEVCKYFPEDKLKCDPSTDLLGLQLSSSIKNILAIGAGIIGESSNELGILVQQGVAETLFIGQKLGIKIETIIGPAFLGDLVATSSSRHSRNHTAGRFFLDGTAAGGVVSKMVSENLGYPEGIPSAIGLVNRFRREKLEGEMRSNCPVIMSLCTIVRARLDSNVVIEIEKFKEKIFDSRKVYNVKFVD